jgi:predicted DNA-binding ribbon-helix-helix protein
VNEEANRPFGDDASPAEGGDKVVDDAELVFRAVTARGERRGIRLERIFWSGLSDAAAARGQPLSQLVGDTASGLQAGGNLASALRVTVARHLRDSLEETRRRSSPQLAFAMLQACPSPAFALSADKKIVSYNRAFVTFIQSRFQATDATELLGGLRLSLDSQLDLLLAQLVQDPTAQVTTGFALGLFERRVRGQLRLALAPTTARQIVVAYIVNA